MSTAKEFSEFLEKEAKRYPEPKVSTLPEWVETWMASLHAETPERPSDESWDIDAEPGEDE